MAMKANKKFSKTPGPVSHHLMKFSVIIRTLVGGWGLKYRDAVVIFCIPSRLSWKLILTQREMLGHIS